MRLEEIWFADDAASDDPTGLPELKRFVEPARGKEEAGFRALLEDPDALSNLGWCGETERPLSRRSRKASHKTRLVGRLH